MDLFNKTDSRVMLCICISRIIFHGRKCVTACRPGWWGGAFCQRDTAGLLSPLTSQWDTRWVNIWQSCEWPIGWKQEKGSVKPCVTRDQPRFTLVCGATHAEWHSGQKSAHDSGWSVTVTFTPPHGVAKPKQHVICGHLKDWPSSRQSCFIAISTFSHDWLFLRATTSEIVRC